MFNNGFRDEARGLAERLIDVLAGHPLVVTPSGSCAAMIREHFEPLFDAGSARAAAARDLAQRTREFAELLTGDLAVDLRSMNARWPGAVAVHESCHARSLGVGDATQRLLEQIDGLELRPLRRPETCCGFGGTFAVRYGLISARMAREKADDVVATAAGALVSTDAGCSMNIAGTCRRGNGGPAILSSAEIVAEALGLLDREVPA
jgi:L-lactate dehydrogenase complex protein LldE